MILILIPLVTTAFWFLGAMASITLPPRTWIAEHLPPVTHFLNCAACSGFWYGAMLGLYFDPIGIWWQSLTLFGAGSMVWTPILGAIMIYSLNLISAVLDETRTDA